MKVPFQSLHDGKCATCSEQKPLDAMVRKNYKKGVYECIDCKVDLEGMRLSMYNKQTKQNMEFNIPKKKLDILLEWVFG